MLAIGRDELIGRKKLGKTIKCCRCGNRHNVLYTKLVLEDGTKVKSDVLQIYRCNRVSYVCGVDGYDIRDKFKNER